MFAVYLLENGELLYICDEEATHQFSPSQFGWVEVTGDWSKTHIWNSETRSMDPLPPE